MAVSKAEQASNSQGRPGKIKVRVRPTSQNDSNMIFVSNGTFDKRFIADTDVMLEPELVTILENSVYKNRNMVEGNHRSNDMLGLREVVNNQPRFIVTRL